MICDLDLTKSGQLRAFRTSQFAVNDCRAHELARLHIADTSGTLNFTGT